MVAGTPKISPALNFSLHAILSCSWCSTGLYITSKYPRCPAFWNTLHHQPQDKPGCLKAQTALYYVRRLCMGHCSTHRCSYHQLLLLIGQRYHSEYNSTLKLCRHLKAISACGIHMLYCPPFIESQLLTSEVMRHNKILLTLWAALHSTTYDKRSLRSKPLYSYTVNGWCSTYGNKALLKHLHHTAFTAMSDSI